jgi:hypothetical protein
LKAKKEAVAVKFRLAFAGLVEGVEGNTFLSQYAVGQVEGNFNPLNSSHFFNAFNHFNLFNWTTLPKTISN